MNFFIIGENGNIGKEVKKEITQKNFNLVDDALKSDVIVLAVNSETAKKYIDLYDNKVILNFSSYKPNKFNVINGIGCSTLSVLIPLYRIKDYLEFAEDINVVTLFPQSAVSNNSINKGLKINKTIYTYEHSHQTELEKIFKRTINMSHIITPAHKYILSNITIKFSSKIDLSDKLPHCEVTSRDGYTWNIVCYIDNIKEPINYIFEILKIEGENIWNQLQQKD